MSYLYSLKLKLLISFIASFFAFFVVGNLAFAQDPGTCYTATYTFDSGLDGWGNIINDHWDGLGYTRVDFTHQTSVYHSSPGSLYYYHDGTPSTQYANISISGADLETTFGISTLIASDLDVKFYGTRNAAGANQYASSVLMELDGGGYEYHQQTKSIAGWTLFDYTGSFTSTDEVSELNIAVAFNTGGTRNAYLDDITIEYCYSGDIGDTCTTVQDHHFAGIISGTWLLSGNAVISDSLLTLTPGDIAAQNLTLASNTAYNAVFSVTQVISESVFFNVILGTDTQAMTITSTGYYTASFTTPNLGGTLGYALQNDSETDAIEIDYTCLIRADGEEELICIAPQNGEFETAADWGWYRGAAWQNPAKNAFLPYPEAGLIQPTSTFTMPSLGAGEYLILGFDAHSEQNNAVIGGQVVAGGSDATFYYETFPVDYRYETDLSLLEALTNANLSLVNASMYAEEALSETVGLDDIIVDNVCIFVSDDPPDLPTPIEDSGAWSVNFGFNYTTCSDIDGIWAYFGVNMAQYRSDYYAGATVWDPVGWVPWLISAFWVIIGSLGCMLLSIYLGIIHTLEYLLNNFLNYAFWFYLSTLGFIAWLGEWLSWGWLSLWNIIQIYFPWLGDALLWLWESLSNVSNWWYLTFWGFALWLALWLLNLNGVRVILNLLIVAWNLFISGIGGTIGGIIQTGVDLWNNYIAPFLGSFSLLGLILGLLVTLATVGFGWVWTVLQWFWANVISLGTVPLSFYYAFDDGLNSSAYDALVECAGVNFWCAFLAGVQLINQIIAHSILYPIVITGIILSTIVILWLNIKELFSIDLNIR